MWGTALSVATSKKHPRGVTVIGRALRPWTERHGTVDGIFSLIQWPRRGQNKFPSGRGSHSATMTSERTARFAISLFGRFQLSGCNGPIELTSKKHAALLAYLAATHPTPHSREKLMTLLWGGHVEPQARQNLRQALSSLRHVLGKDVAHRYGPSRFLRIIIGSRHRQPDFH